jgi:UPF0176 protein
MMPENKDLLSSFYANSRSNTISNDLFRAWDPLVVLGHICKELTLSYHFLQIISFKDKGLRFHARMRLNIAVEHDDHSFFVDQVRDKIVADGLNDETFDVTNIGVHLKAKFNEILDNQTPLWLILEIITVKWLF